jgi:hypothetical protein
MRGIAEVKLLNHTRWTLASFLLRLHRGKNRHGGAKGTKAHMV